MTRRGTLCATVLIVLLAVPHAQAAAPTHTLRLVMDRTGTVDVVLPTFKIEKAALTKTAHGVSGLVFERQGEKYSVNGNHLLAESVNLDPDRTWIDLVDFHSNEQGEDLPFAAGRYRLSTTSASGGSAVLTLTVTGLKKDLTVRPVARQHGASGGAQRLDNLVGANGALTGTQSLGRVNRGYALVSVGVETSTAGGRVGTDRVCLRQAEGQCFPLGFESELVSATPFGQYITAVYAPDSVPTGPLIGEEGVTGVSTPSRAWGWSILIETVP
jgi:hypothetical protein